MAVTLQVQLEALARQFREAGVPIATEPLGSIGSWWSSTEVLCSLAALRLTRSTADDSACKRLLLEWVGLDADTVRRLGETARLEDQSLVAVAAREVQRRALQPLHAARLSRLLAALSRWQATARAHGMRTVARAISADLRGQPAAHGERLHGKL